MTTIPLDLDDYTLLPKGKIAFVVTYLEMTRKPTAPLVDNRSDLTLMRWKDPDLDEYRSIFKDVGEDWLWFARLTIPDEELKSALNDPARPLFAPVLNGRKVGLLELDFTDPAQPELAYFGLVPDAIGGGVGRWLMQQAIDSAWERPETRRLWLHTCTGDSPQALGFYQSCGFVPYQRGIEVADDPRVSGKISQAKAPHVPVI